MTDLMTDLYNRAIDNANNLGGYAIEQTAHGEVRCLIVPKDSRTRPGRARQFSKAWRLDGKIISAAKLAALLNS